MSNQLQQLNLETCSDVELRHWVQQAHPYVLAYLEATRRLAEPDRGENETDADCQAGRSHGLGLTGRVSPPSNEASPTLCEDHYDVILNMPDRLIRYKDRSSTASVFKVKPLKGIGPTRLKILVWMMEHPGRPISYEDAPLISGDPNGYCGPNTFAQTIRHLRNFLGGGGRKNPYIVSIPSYEPHTPAQAGAYVMEAPFKYLVIRRQKKSGYQADVTAMSS